jgi:pyrroloquinoline quinone (PQQ) biosynthesis protein C
MSDVFVRSGPLTELDSYPAWARDIVQSCAPAKQAVVGHAVFELMRDIKLSTSATRMFMISGWPVIEQFPQFMAMSLTKIRYGRSVGQDMARRYLIRNIRVEQNHADHWVEWSKAVGVSLQDLIESDVPLSTHALSHWCGHVCDRDSLPAAMAATNYAIEGVTGEWSTVICSKNDYEMSFDPQVRAKAMKWLKLHAHYDDTHPWEALEIICTIMGSDPSSKGIELLRSSILKSYDYLHLTLEHILRTHLQDADDDAQSPALEAYRNLKVA